MADLVDYAKEELRRAGLFDKDSDYGGMLGDAVMKMIKLFDEENHSGASASRAIALFSRLAKFEPLTPLTGNNDEWNKAGSNLWQNKRCSSVFRERVDGAWRAYNIDGIVWRDPEGRCYTNRESCVDVTFPYMPATKFVDVDADGKPVKGE